LEKPELIAHRGWARRYPENTLAAVRAAIDAGARFVEVDVQLSRDSEPFLMHDRTLARMCGVKGALADLSSREVARLRASEAERFGAKFADEPVASLEAFAAEVARAPAVFAFVELKRASIEVFGAAAVLDAVLPRLAPLAGRCALISFDFGALASARGRSPLPVGPVLGEWKERAAPALAALRPEYVFCDVEKLPGRGSLALGGARLAVYEVDDVQLALALAERGADFVETFAVGEMLRALEAV
jgi:glycerophosphoryl diester phosphodiesterase